jgi:Zn-dependent protease
MQNGNVYESLFHLMKFFVPFLFALCFHEFAHGVVARMRGDRTAEIMGRLTLNPLAHADPVGTFLLPIIGFFSHMPMFGWAKPVPVDERNLKNPKADMFWVAAAGPLSNLLLAAVTALGTAIFFRANIEAIFERQESTLQILDVLQQFVLLNVYLAFFNLIPLHPLDGGKVIARFLPHEVNRKLEDMQTYTSFLLLILFVSGAAYLIAGPAQWFSNFLLGIAGAMVGGK